jgi:hypothetical protein
MSCALSRARFRSRHFDVRMDVSRPLHAIGALGSKSAAPEPTANVLTLSVTGNEAMNTE